MEKLSDTRDMGDIGLDSEGFPDEYDPKTVRGVPESSSSEKNYQQENTNYEEQDEVRDWETQGQFGPGDEAFEVFSEVMDDPVEELEDQEVVTDGGQDVYGEEVYTDGGRPTMDDVDHEGPYGDNEDVDMNGAPW